MNERNVIRAGSNHRDGKILDRANEDFIDSLPKSVQLVLLTVGMFVFFGAHNLLQEAFIKLPGFEFGVMLGYMEVIGVSMGSYIERTYVAKETERKAPLSAYPLLSFCLLTSAGLSNMSLNYINFPTKVVFRSCKILPTMMISTIMNKRVFSPSEYFFGMIVCLGLILFTVADMQLAMKLNPIGIILVSLSVVADSIIPNVQEKLFNHGSSRLEVTWYSNIFTLIAMTFSTFVSGDLISFYTFMLSDSILVIYASVYIFLSYVAISLFLQIVKRFGAVTGVLTAAARKVMSLILSFLIFPKEFSWFYVWGSSLVFGGLVATSIIKINKKLSRSENEEKIPVYTINDNKKLKEVLNENTDSKI